MQQAAVLAGWYATPENPEGYLVFIRRSLQGSHGGQIGLPGGKREAGDETLAHTALRETEEEIGLSPQAVELVCPLSPVCTGNGRYEVFPWLGIIQPLENWRPDPAEVSEVIPLAVRDLCNENSRTTCRRTLHGEARPKDVPCIRVGTVEIWGMTLKILEELLPKLEGAGAPAPNESADYGDLAGRGKKR